jgi:hypothetical protein
MIDFSLDFKDGLPQRRTKIYAADAGAFSNKAGLF